LAKRNAGQVRSEEDNGFNANPESKAKHQEVPKERVTIKPVRGLRKQHKGRMLLQVATGSQRN
jgi:hypothetical protein